MTWLRERQSSSGKIGSRLAKTQQMCSLLSASWWTPWGQWLRLALQLQPSLKGLWMRLIISSFYFFFSWGFALDFCSVSLPLNYLPGLVRDTLLEKGKVFTQKYLLYAERERQKGPQLWRSASRTPWAMGEEAAGTPLEDRIQSKSQQSLKSFACS